MMNLYVKPHAQHITPLVPALGTKTLNQLEKPLLQAQKIVVGVHNATRILDVAALFGEPRPFMRGGNLLTPDSVYVAPYKKKHLKLPDWPQGRKKLQKEQNHWIIGDLETISWQKR